MARTSWCVRVSVCACVCVCVCQRAGECGRDRARATEAVFGLHLGVCVSVCVRLCTWKTLKHAVRMMGVVAELGSVSLVCVRVCVFVFVYVEVCVGVCTYVRTYRRTPTHAYAHRLAY